MVVKECQRLADYEFLRIANAPMDEATAVRLAGIDALYEDDMPWNHRARKCCADGVPDECRTGNLNGTAPNHMYQLNYDGKLFDDTRSDGSPWVSNER